MENHGRACTQVLFLRKVELGCFHFLKIVTGWLVHSAGLQPRWYLPPGSSRGSALSKGEW